MIINTITVYDSGYSMEKERQEGQEKKICK